MAVVSHFVCVGRNIDVRLAFALEVFFASAVGAAGREETASLLSGAFGAFCMRTCNSIHPGSLKILRSLQLLPTFHVRSISRCRRRCHLPCGIVVISLWRKALCFPFRPHQGKTIQVLCRPGCHLFLRIIITNVQRKTQTATHALFGQLRRSNWHGSASRS